MSDRKATIKAKAETLILDILKNGLQTDDPLLKPSIKKLEPYKDKLAKIDSKIVKLGLNMVNVQPTTDNDDYEAKRVAKALVDKLEKMKSSFGL